MKTSNGSVNNHTGRINDSPTAKQASVNMRRQHSRKNEKTQIGSERIWINLE